MNDVIRIPLLSATSKERLGYPTQKPEGLLEPLIGLYKSSRSGSYPFCGSGTTLAAAKKLERKWIGIDISKAACRYVLTEITGIA